MTPLQQYLGALKGEVKLWCHNNAEIYVFFANAIGIPTRKVSVGGEFDACSLSGHAFAESYIKEQNRWAYVDVTSANILVRNTEGLYLNTLDLFYLTLLGAYPENFKISFVDHGNLHEQSYVGDLTYHEKYYFRRDAAFNFPIPEKNSFLKKEFFEKYDYIFNPAFVHSLHASNAKHYLALFFVYGEIVLVLFWLIIFAVYAKFLLSLVKRKN
jgi:hypothetical protein